jgi:SAM-dependent methyltransferase
LKAEPHRSFLRLQFLAPAAGETDTTSYSYYADACRLDYSHTKWKRYDDDFIAMLNAMRIRLEGQRVLCISEGPGFFAQRIMRECREVVVTEFNYDAVNAMRQELGVTAAVYDFNEHLLSEIFPDKQFDLIFMRSCLAFCSNLPRLARDIARSLRSGGIAYVFFHRPTLGGCLQWMHDEYTSNYWYCPETVERLFSEAGMRPMHELSRFKYDEDPRRKYRPTFKTKVIYDPAWYFYFLKSKLLNKHFSRELNEIGYGIFFAKGPAGDSGPG